jgi:hypothetical protein
LKSTRSVGASSPTRPSIFIVSGECFRCRFRSREEAFSFCAHFSTSSPPTTRATTAIDGLWVFLATGHADEALCLDWPRDELFAVPKLWSRVDLCGCALQIGDREVIGITPAEIRIKTASGATPAFYRKAVVDYRLVYETRLKLIRGNYASDSEEPQLRAFEHAVSVFRANHRNATLEDAKAAVLAAIAAKGRQP